jgi:hypothetical protein
MLSLRYVPGKQADERVAMRLFMTHDSYVELDEGARAAGHDSLVACATDYPRKFVQFLLTEVDQRPDILVAPIEGGRTLASSHELGVELASSLAGTKPIDLDVTPVELTCYVTPEGFDWPIPTTTEEDLRNQVRAERAAQVLCHVTVEPPNLAF